MTTRLALELLIGAIAVYAGLALLLYLAQDIILFHPRPNDERLATRFEPHSVELKFDKQQLTGWYLPPADAADERLLVYFGGNAEDLAWRLPELQAWGYAALVMNYRGYGSSSGAPSEAALFNDAERIYDTIHNLTGRQFTCVVAFGRSLGSGVAVWLAHRRPVCGVVLVTPYDSVLRVAESRYGLFPVRQLLRHRFDSINHLPGDVPALFIVAGRDRVIPNERSKALFDAWPGPRQWTFIDNANHNDPERYPAFADAVQRFMDSLTAER